MSATFVVMTSEQAVEVRGLLLALHGDNTRLLAELFDPTIVGPDQAEALPTIVERVDGFLAHGGGRNIVPIAEVINLLLDIRSIATSTIESGDTP